MVAILEADVTLAKGTNTRGARRRCMGNDALIPTAAAVVWIDVLVGFAAVRSNLITIAVRFLAIRDAALPVDARGSSVRLIRALGSAGTAVVHALVHVDFAAIGDALVAVAKPRGARDAA